MLESNIIIPNKSYRQLESHLQRRGTVEQVAFVFATVSKSSTSVIFRFKKALFVRADEYVDQSCSYVELEDEMRAKIIKTAWDLDTGIIEFHSHPQGGAAIFSAADFEGFSEFVPHVWWRLDGKPCAAIVFSESGFDGLVWAHSPEKPEPLTRITIPQLLRRRYLYPNGLSLESRGAHVIKAS